AVSKPTWSPPSGGPEVRLKPDATGFETAIRWYRSFYFRIGFTFVLFVIGLIVLQGVVSNAVRMRSPLRGRSPNAVVAIVAADLGALLDQNASADVDAYLKREYADSQPIYVVMRDGSTASNRTAPLAPA